MNVRTANSGVTWNQFTPLISWLFFRGVVFRNTSQGWAVGFTETHLPAGGVLRYGIILHTTDGGANWTIQAHPFGHQFTGVSFVDDQAGWVSGFGAVFRTLDGGATWTQVGGAMPRLLDVAAFPDPVNGWNVGYEFWYPTGNPPAHYRALVLRRA